MRPLFSHIALVLVGTCIITFELAKHALEQLADRSRN
jgi:hypothetical protein